MIEDILQPLPKEVEEELDKILDKEDIDQLWIGNFQTHICVHKGKKGNYVKVMPNVNPFIIYDCL